MASTMRWQRTLWREWRHTGDVAFAARLFTVLGTMAMGPGMLPALLPGAALFGAQAGALVGILVAILPHLRPVRALCLPSFDALLPALLLGALGGAAVLPAMSRINTADFTMRNGLWALLAWPRAHRRLLGDFYHLLGFLISEAFRLLFIGILVAFGVAIMGAIINAATQLNEQAITSIVVGTGGVILVGVLLGDFNRAVREGRLSVAMAVLFFGALPVPLLLLRGGSAAVICYSTVLLLGIDLGVWWGALRQPADNEAIYVGRGRWAWWAGRPTPAELETAMTEAARAHAPARQGWGEALEEIAARKRVPGAPSALVRGATHAAWRERFQARQLLAFVGAPALAPLTTVLDNTVVRRDALWLIRATCADTRTRLGRHAERRLCPHCLTKCIEHRLPLPWNERVAFYACRTCLQSREFLEGEALFVVDDRMTERLTHAGGVIRLNGLKLNAPADCDRILIAHAGEYDIERFCVMLGNDTDPVRAARYPRLPVTLACPVPENARRILDKLFGTVTDGGGA